MKSWGGGGLGTTQQRSGSPSEQERGLHCQLPLTCPCSPPPSLTANLLHDQGAQAIAVAVRENCALTSLQ